MSNQSAANSASSSSPLKLLRLLETLKRTEAGTALYQYIARTLDASETQHLEIEQAYADLISLLLDSYAKQLPSDSPQYVHLKLLQMQLTPPLSAAEFTALRKFSETASAEIAQIKLANRRLLEEIFEPLLDAFGARTEKVATTTVAPAAYVAPMAETPQTGVETEAESAKTQEAKIIEVEQRVDTAYRQHLKEKREGILKIQETLSKQVREVIKQNEEFGGLLEVQLDALRHAGNIQEIETLRRMLVHEVSKLIQGHRSVSSKLDETHNYLRIIETDSQKLSDELTRVHLLSLTDELTGLHNRRAFLRRLEDEVSRVQRYGNPLALALIDLDSFKGINDKYGHAAGDEVLRVFSHSILSIFRHHDMVARYGGEEFAVLLPNTDSDGAMRALRKVQKRSAECTFQHEGTTMPLPTFSAGVALYRPGETPDDLIDRSDKALYRAKRMGRNRIELAQAVETAGKVLG